MGTTGFIVMLKVFVKGHTSLGFCFLINSILWGLNCLGSLMLFKEANFLYGLRQVEMKLGQKIKVDKDGNFSL